VKTLSNDNLAQLVSYEDIFDNESIEFNERFGNSIRSMHNYVPLNPFKATVLVSQIPESIQVAHEIDIDSPAS
jgi:hypothetical protein